MPGDLASCAQCRASLADDLLPLVSDEAGASFTQAYGVARDGAPRGWLVAVAAVLVSLIVAVLVGRQQARTAASVVTPTTIFASFPDSPPVIIHRPDATRPLAATSTTLDFLSGVTTGTNLAVYGTVTQAGRTYARITVLDLDANRLVFASLPGYAASSLTGPSPSMTATFAAHHLFVGVDGLVYAQSDTLTGPVNLLGAGSYFLAAVSPTHVWIVDANGRQATVREVDSSGRAIISASAPADWSPYAATAAGIILVRVDVGRHQPAFEVWDPITGKIRFDGGVGSTVIAASANVVAWSYGCTLSPCTARITDLNTGRERAIVQLELSRPSSGAAMSPDGRYLALFSTAIDGNGVAGVLVADLDLGTSQVVDPGPAQFNGPWSLVWSSSSQWLFLGSSSDLVGYRIADPTGFRHINLPTGLLVGASVIAS